MTGLNEIENVYGETVEFYDLSALSQIGNKKIVLNKFADMVKDLDGIILDIGAGTGKTTTILNILANLIYQNKNVLVVSKNNSAIENVAEELEKMEIPKSFIRMRKFRYNEK